MHLLGWLFFLQKKSFCCIRENWKTFHFQNKKYFWKDSYFSSPNFLDKSSFRRKLFFSLLISFSITKVYPKMCNFDQVLKAFNFSSIITDLGLTPILRPKTSSMRQIHFSSYMGKLSIFPICQTFCWNGLKGVSNCIVCSFSIVLAHNMLNAQYYSGRKKSVLPLFGPLCYAPKILFR